jgi:hypothetical protein
LWTNVDQATTINLPARGVHAGMLWHGGMAAWPGRLPQVRRIDCVDRVPLVECAV